MESVAKQTPLFLGEILLATLFEFFASLMAVGALGICILVGLFVVPILLIIALIYILIKG